MKNKYPLLDIQHICQDYRIRTAPAYHKHSRRGWLNISCIFCGSSHSKFHLGYNLTAGYFFCWRCGWHPQRDTLLSLLHIPPFQYKDFLKKYSIDPLPIQPDLPPPATVEMPDGCGPLNDRHKDYLRSRGYNPASLQHIWDLRGTTHWGADSFRVIAPITFHGQIVSYQGRDYTGKQQSPYKACPNEKEILPHKNMLYGFDAARWDTCVVVEGITGVWKLGPGAVATFGAEFTASQMLLIVQHFKRAIIFFDDDDAGQTNADKMEMTLETMGVSTEIIVPSGRQDSGNIPDELAKEIMSEVKK